VKWVLVVFLVCAISLLDGKPGVSYGQESSTNKQKEDAITRTDQAAFTVIGIAIRTNNAKEATDHAVIPRQWEKFFSEGIPGKSPNQAGSILYAIYTDYASDHTGDYTYIIGLPVQEGTRPPDGMVAVRVPAGQYAKFTTEQGPFAKIMPAAWQHIFQLEGEGKLKRAYKTDFEVYDQRAQDPQNARVDIFLGLK